MEHILYTRQYAKYYLNFLTWSSEYLSEAIIIIISIVQTKRLRIDNVPKITEVSSAMAIHLWSLTGWLWWF